MINGISELWRSGKAEHIMGLVKALQKRNPVSSCHNHPRSLCHHLANNKYELSPEAQLQQPTGELLSASGTALAGRLPPSTEGPRRRRSAQHRRRRWRSLRPKQLHRSARGHTNLHQKNSSTKPNKPKSQQCKNPAEEDQK